MPRIAKGKPRPNRRKHVPLDAIDFGTGREVYVPLRSPPRLSPVQAALASLDRTDRFLLVQELVREMCAGQNLVQRAQLADRVWNTCTAVINEVRM
jgi:hypothetical protein